MTFLSKFSPTPPHVFWIKKYLFKETINWKLNIKLYNLINFFLVSAFSNFIVKNAHFVKLFMAWFRTITSRTHPLYNRQSTNGMFHVLKLDRREEIVEKITKIYLTKRERKMKTCVHSMISPLLIFVILLMKSEGKSW